ncbi:PTS ascorbate transporter subunit IIC [Spiroplasma alleghenense]|uniref:Ascorbate-specific PTS system EIIC component n=1 Tax=Spiroplasma alleghenense TaxID=216931 RepID=A0A345Z3G6_9MOLU|nr:PTS ascorbate transporter subunit IIC [Spiroplasma alleghenense]AXK51145.1 PTS system, ascorbate-specific IIC component [Spiroplasma alleghenense]
MAEFTSFLKDFFGFPAILIGIFALLGNLLQRKSFTNSIISTLTAALGFLILQAGGGFISDVLVKFSAGFKELFGIHGVLPNSDPLAINILATVSDVATMASFMLLISIILNVALARVTKFKYIFLTGHHALYSCVALAFLFKVANISIETEWWYYIIVGSIIISIYMLLTPAMTSKQMQFLTKSDKIFIGHSNSFGFAIAGQIGNLVGKLRKGKIQSTENINFPKWLSIFKHSAISVTITMFILFSVIYFSLWAIEGREAMEKIGILQAGESPVALVFILSLKFTAGLEVLMFGIRMMIGELMPALEGISKRFIPGARMAVDCPVVFAYAPTAVLIGFLSSLAGGIVGFGISIGLNSAAPAVISAVIIPGIVHHFFTGGTAATFANVKGGVLGAVLGSFVNGLITTFIPVMFLAMQSSFNFTFQPDGALMFAETDYSIFATIGSFLQWLPAKWILMVVAILLLIYLIVDGVIHEVKDRKNNPDKYLKIKENRLQEKLQYLSERKALKEKRSADRAEEKL